MNDYGQFTTASSKARESRFRSEPFRLSAKRPKTDDDDLLTGSSRLDVREREFGVHAREIRTMTDADDTAGRTTKPGPSPGLRSFSGSGPRRQHFIPARRVAP